MFKFLKRIHKNTPDHTKRVIEVKVGGWLGRFMWNHGWGAMTIPFPFFILMMFWTIESQPDGEVDPLIRVHEWVHVAQNEMNKYWFISWARYLWQDWLNFSFSDWRKNGFAKASMDAYYANKYESAAYVVEDIAQKNGLPDWAK